MCNLSPEILSLIGILVGVAVFIVVSFMGFDIKVVALLSAAVVALFSGLNPYQALTEFFMPGAAGVVSSYFMLFTFSAIFARLIGESGAAASIAFKITRLARNAKNIETQRFLAVLTLPLVNAIITMGGVNVFVVTFIMVGLARPLFKELDIPWWLYTCNSLGSSTFTIGMMPGSPQMQNLIPQDTFGTTPMAAPVLGILCACLTMGLGSCYIMYQVRRTSKKGEGFMPTGEVIDRENLTAPNIEEMPLWKALLPMIVLLIVLNGLEQPAPLALLVAIIVAYLLYDPRKLNIKKMLTDGMTAGLIPLFGLACATGFGKVVSNVSGFTTITDSLAVLGTGAFSIVIIVNVCSGICGSASSGENIALAAFGDRFIASGIPGEQLHRLVAMSSTGLDTLPHSAGIVTALTVSKLTHKQAYINNFVLSVVLPIVMSFIAAALISMGFYF